jgi:hypothetical protein
MMGEASTFFPSVLYHTFHNPAKTKSFILEMHRIGTLLDLSSLKTYFPVLSQRANNSENFCHGVIRF